jgi:hypothetical protein
MFALLLFGTAQGQRFAAAPAEPYESDILTARPIRYYLGLAIGGYAYQHEGAFSPNCNCSFSGERDAGLFIGPEFIVHFPKSGFAFKGMLLYRNVSATFSQHFSKRSSVVLGQNQDALLDYERWSDVTLRYVDILPSVSWYFPKLPVFLAAGIALSIPVKSVYNNNERILTDGYVYLNGSNQTVLLDETSISGASNLRIDFHASAGVDIYLADHFYLTPQAGAILPLRAVSGKDPDWRILTEYAVLVVKYRF